MLVDGIVGFRNLPSLYGGLLSLRYCPWRLEFWTTLFWWLVWLVTLSLPNGCRFGGVPSGIGGCQGAFNLFLGGLGLVGCGCSYPFADCCGVAAAGAGLDKPTGWGD